MATSTNKIVGPLAQGVLDPETGVDVNRILIHSLANRAREALPRGPGQRKVPKPSFNLGSISLRPSGNDLKRSKAARRANQRPSRQLQKTARDPLDALYDSDGPRDPIRIDFDLHMDPSSLQKSP